MKNKNFQIEFDKTTGCISGVYNPNDTSNMNWCSYHGKWGDVNLKDYPTNLPELKIAPMPTLEMVSFTEDDEKAKSVYVNKLMEITTERYFTESGNFAEHVTVKNITNTVIFVNRDNMGIRIPLNDGYTYADECMVNKCNTHIWAGKNTTWINALKMGEGEINLGMFVTKGSFDSYSQYECKSNQRGYFELNPVGCMLNSGECYEMQWEWFWHKGNEDFGKKLALFDSYIGINAKHYTVFFGEDIDFTITAKLKEEPTVTCDGKPIKYEKTDGKYRVVFRPARTGEHKFVVKIGGYETFAEFMCKVPLKELTENRLDFIVEKQQCLVKNSPLYGAFLIYDNETECQYFNDFNHDHNACRERLNMGFLLIHYLTVKDNKKYRKALDLYIDFIYREIYDETTGEVFNTIGKNRNALRLYNAPGVMMLFSEMYLLTKDKKYLKDIVCLAKHYYSIDGHKCYSNAVAVKKVLSALKEAGMQEEYDIMFGFFKKHIDNMINNGTSYPKHEVNYEQTIVTPVVNCISEMGLFDDSHDYIKEAAKHIKCLERFNGMQPSFHLNEIAIRYWDDFWFGKNRLMGDTLPHHLSALTARAYISYYRLTGDTDWLKRGEECLRNCLCLIDDNGVGHAAYVYPHTVGSARGQLYDRWANDQDLPLYEAMYMSDLIPEFSVE